MATAVCSCFYSYRSAERRVESDVANALRHTLAQLPADVVSADTIRCYRDFLTIPELKDTACIAMVTVMSNGRQQTKMVAQANCDAITIFMLSDQRASATLLFIGLLWMAGSMWYLRRQNPALIVQGLSYGGIVFANDRFMNAKGENIHLTPMQHTLLSMFMTSADHTLSKQDICDRLWPKKPDASDTLYTLIRRLKPIVEANSELKIESDRGRNYRLEHRT